jgi:hypothetical protein
MFFSGVRLKKGGLTAKCHVDQHSLGVLYAPRIADIPDPELLADRYVFVPKKLCFGSRDEHSEQR